MLSATCELARFRCLPVVRGLDETTQHCTVFATSGLQSHFAHCCSHYSNVAEQHLLRFNRCVWVNVKHWFDILRLREMKSISLQHFRGGPPPPLKNLKKIIFWVKSVFFPQKTPKNFFKGAPPPPLTWNPGSAPNNYLFSHCCSHYSNVAEQHLLRFNRCVWVNVKPWFDILRLREMKSISLQHFIWWSYRFSGAMTKMECPLCFPSALWL
jgi:hypothetical protein